MEDDSPYQISVAHAGASNGIAPDTVRDAVVSALKSRRCDAAQISVALVDDPTIAELNEHFLDHTGPTDVISFDLGEPNTQTVDGELVISTDTAKREAGRRGIDVSAEVMLYAVHGTLHLLGMDDATPEQAAEMHDVEDRILTDLGVGPVFRAAHHS